MENTTLNLDADLIDIRDIIERVEELETELEGLKSDSELDWPEWIKAYKSYHHPHEGTKTAEANELAALLSILEELKGNGGDEKWRGDWYPVTLISKDYFIDYIQDIIDDCYEMPKEMNSGSWPYRHITIDYEAAAEEAKQDYSEIDIGVTAYLYR